MKYITKEPINGVTEFESKRELGIASIAFDKGPFFFAEPDCDAESAFINVFKTDDPSEEPVTIKLAHDPKDYELFERDDNKCQAKPKEPPTDEEVKDALAEFANESLECEIEARADDLLAIGFATEII